MTSNTASASNNNTPDAVDTAQAFVNNPDASAVHTAYGAVHPSRRAAWQGAAVAWLLTNAVDSAMAFVDAINTLPAAVTSRTREKLTDEQCDVIRTSFLTHVSMWDDTQWDDDMLTMPAALVSAAVSKLTAVTTAAVNNASLSINRTNHDVALCDVVPAGTVVTGNYRGTGYRATIHANDRITVGKVSFTNISDAARSIVDRPQNGWTFWRHDGRTLAQLRDAMS